MSVSDDRTRLRHIIDAGNEIAEFTQNVTREAFDSDRLLQRGIERLVEIIGEASIQISVEFKEKYPDLPWAVMRGMRNRISHAYFEVNYDLLWNTAISDVPELLKLIQPIMDDLDRTQGK